MLWCVCLFPLQILTSRCAGRGRMWGKPKTESCRSLTQRYSERLYLSMCSLSFLFLVSLFLTLFWPFRRLNLFPPLLSRCPSDRLRSAAWCILDLILPDTRIPSFALWIAVCVHCLVHCHCSRIDHVPGRLRCSTPWGWPVIPALCNSHSRHTIGLDRGISYGFVTKRSFSSGRRSGGI